MCPRGLKWAGEPVVYIVHRVFGIPNGPPRPGHIPAMGIEGGTVGVGDHIFVVVVVDVLVCVVLSCYVCLFFSLGHVVAEARIFLRQRHVRFAVVIIAVYNATIFETLQFYVLRDFEIGLIVVSGTIAFDGVELVEVRLSDIIVQVTLPKYMLGCGPCIFASFAFALVILD